jgi:hypothetical protein
MVRAEDVLTIRIQLLTNLHTKGHEKQTKKTPGPIAIKNTHPSKFSGEHDGHQKKGKEEQKQNRKNDETVYGVKNSEQFHVLETAKILKRGCPKSHIVMLSVSETSPILFDSKGDS